MKRKTSFSKDRTRYDGLKSNCKPCDKEFARIYKLNHPDKIKEHGRRFRALKPIYGLYQNSIRADRNKGYNYCSYEEFYKVVDCKICIYCGFSGKVGSDRIDNSRGHEINNILPCCSLCNSVRSNLFSVKEMLLLGLIIRKIRKSRGDLIISIKNLRKFQTKLLLGN